MKVYEVEKSWVKGFFLNLLLKERSTMILYIENMIK